MRWEKAAKLLALARELAGTRTGLTLDEMAQCVGVERRTAERMRDALRDLFPGFEARAEDRTKRFRIVGGLSPSMLAPTADELAELELAVRGLAGIGQSSRADLLQSLSAKIRAAQKCGPLERVETDLEALVLAEAVAVAAGPRRAIAPATLATLREAIKALATVRFRYQGQSRHVDPWGLLLGRVPYLVGPAVPLPKPVLWRLDRIAEVVTAEGKSARPADFSIEDFAARSFGTFQEAIYDVALRFTAEAAEEAGGFMFHPAQILNAEANGALTVRFQAGGLLELVHHLFTWGDTVEILAPAELRSLMRSELSRAIRWHGEAV